MTNLTLYWLIPKDRSSRVRWLLRELDVEFREQQMNASVGEHRNGDYLDGFDNKITVHAYANPESPSSGGGYGLIRFKKKTNEVTFECWPRDVNVSKPGAKQFVGWPKTIKLAENRGQKVTGHLPEIEAPQGVKRPVLRVSHAKSGELVYAVRLTQSRVKPWIYSEGIYKVEFGDPDTNEWTVVEGKKE